MLKTRKKRDRDRDRDRDLIWSFLLRYYRRKDLITFLSSHHDRKPRKSCDRAMPCETLFQGFQFRISTFIRRTEQFFLHYSRPFDLGQLLSNSPCPPLLLQPSEQLHPEQSKVLSPRRTKAVDLVENLLLPGQPLEVQSPDRDLLIFYRVKVYWPL